LSFPFSLARAQAPAKKQNVTRTRRPNPLQQLLDRAEKAIAEEKFADAIAALDEFLKDQPNDAYAHFHLGYAYTGLKDWQKAVVSYRRAAELKPDMAAAHLNLGLLLYEHESPQASIEPLRRAAELLANEARPHFLLGTALERSGRAAEAVTEYRAAAALDNKDAETQLALGRALLNSGKHAEAEAAFRQTLALDSTKLPARLGLAQALLVQKKLPAAAAELEAYLAAKPDEAHAWLQLANLRVETESFDAALQALDRADAAAGPTPESLRLRADIYLAQKKLDEAIVIIRTLVAQQPNDPLARARLGRLYLEQRDFPAAERELLAALQLDPEQIEPLRDLVSTYYLGEKYEATLRMMDRLAQRETPSAFFWFIRATCYDKLLWKAEAVEAYEKFLALDEGRSHNQGIQARARVRTLKRELQSRK
jgi:tetratricopeptide (TPR) repeat protein